MDPEHPLREPRARGTVIELAELMETKLGQLGPEIADHIIAAVPELHGDDEIRSAMVDNAAAHIGAMIALARYGTPAEGMQPPAQAVHFAKMMVHRDVPLATMLRCYHIGQNEIWHKWFDLVCSDLEDPDQVRRRVAASTDFISVYLDSVRENVTVVYEEERERWRRSRAAVREGTIREVLSRSLAGVDDASRKLRYELRRHHVALALQADTASDPGTRRQELEAFASGLASALGAGPPMFMTATDGVIYAWVASNHAAELSALPRTDLPHGCRGGIGEPGAGPNGFRTSHEQALHALHCGSAGSDPAALVAYADIALATVLLADPRAAELFAAYELAGLDSDDAAAQDLRNTLECFLEEDGNQKRAAARLAMHEKTVAHRIRRAEDALARPISRRRAALQCALIIRRASSRA